MVVLFFECVLCNYFGGETVGSILEVIPDYKGSYAGYVMKKAHPTADMLSAKLVSKIPFYLWIVNLFEW